MLGTEEIVEEVQGFSGNDLEHLREEARTNLLFLSLGVLGYKDVSANTHGAFCRFIESETRRRRLGMMPRAHLKSTLATIADSVRLGIKDPDNHRGLIAAETSTLSEKFLSEIKQHFEKNQLLRSLFPELIPTRFSGPGVQWSSTMATLVRSTGHREPTWQAIGVGAASVGSHYTRIKCDDLIGFEALLSPATMARTIQWVNNIEPLLVNQRVDIIDFIGTRWAKNDLYHHLMEVYGSELAVFTRSAVEAGQIIFPNLHDWNEYERIQRINPAQWAAQYNNNPLEGTNRDLPAEKLQTFRLSHDEQEVACQDGKKYRVEDLDRVLTADPNSGSPTAPDAAAVIVTGVSHDSRVFVLHAWSGRPSPSGLVDKIYEVAKRWKVRVVGIEKAGQQNTEFYFKEKIEKAGEYIRVEPLNPRGKHKEDRVRTTVEPLLRSHLLYLLPSQTTLRQQISDFPETILWDEVDALAYGSDLWRKGTSTEQLTRRRDVTKKVLALRNRFTGY